MCVRAMVKKSFENNNLVVGRIHQNLVENFEKARDIFYLSMYHAIRLRIISPQCLSGGFYTSYVGVGTFQYVL